MSARRLRYSHSRSVYTAALFDNQNAIPMPTIASRGPRAIRTPGEASRAEKNVSPAPPRAAVTAIPIAEPCRGTTSLPCSPRRTSARRSISHSRSTRASSCSILSEPSFPSTFAKCSTNSTNMTPPSRLTSKLVPQCSHTMKCALAGSERGAPQSAHRTETVVVTVTSLASSTC